jgi:hypothetical protein
LLLECVEAYSELDQEQQRVYQELLQTEAFKEIAPMMMTTFEKGVVKGQEIGRRILRALLEQRFGPLGDAVLNKIDSLPVERVEQVALAVLNAKSLAELGLDE